ncbi:MAG: hypothetical protein HWN65_09225 [Candidatus Helarchaeota archaeon]|nr:hypothetical protein [Candidatus Helarchaeota archaeon]
MGTVKSFKKVLREHGFYLVKNGKNIQFIKHDAKLGGVYADVGEKTIIKVQDAGFTRTFHNRKELNSFLKNLKQNLNFISPELVRILERNQIRELLEKITPQN